MAGLDAQTVICENLASLLQVLKSLFPLFSVDSALTFLSLSHSAPPVVISSSPTTPHVKAKGLLFMKHFPRPEQPGHETLPYPLHVCVCVRR